MPSPIEAVLAACGGPIQTLYGGVSFVLAKNLYSILAYSMMKAMSMDLLYTWPSDVQSTFHFINDNRVYSSVVLETT